MSLYQKYRPTTPSQIIGNADTMATLEAKFTKPNHPHVLAFTGPRGCGKTTLARMVAKHYLGCTDETIWENDTTNDRGIDFAREVGERMRYAPMDGGNFCIIIDEAHKLTTDGKSGLLKHLEDHPAHVYVFLCTSDAGELWKNKDGLALKTRTSEFVVEDLSEAELYKLVTLVSKKEGQEIDKGVRERIADSAEGSARMALTLLEMVFDNPDVDSCLRIIKGASGMGSELTTEQMDLFRALLAKAPWETVAPMIKKLGTKDAEGIRRALMGYMSSVLLSGGASTKRAGLIMEHFCDPFYTGGMPLLTLACYQVTIL